MPLCEDEPHVKEVVQFNERVLNALEFNTGVTHHVHIRIEAEHQLLRS